MTEIFVMPDTKTRLARFSPTDTAIAALAEQYLPLRIADVNDLAGFAIVHRARMDIKDKRCAVEKVRKELKADALEYGRKVDGEAKRLCALIEPIEAHLDAEERTFSNSRERIKNEARLKAEAEAKAIADAEAARVKAEHDAEIERVRVEREKLDAERKAMEAEREAEAAKQRAAQEKLDAERRAIEAEKQRLSEIEAARLREIEMKRREAEAAERARIETEHRIAREAEAAKAKADAEEAARVRAAAILPDRGKLIAFALDVSHIVIPDLSPELKATQERVQLIIATAANDIADIAEGMM